MLKGNPHFQYYKEAVDLLNQLVPQKNYSLESSESLINNLQFKSFLKYFPGIVSVLDYSTRGYLYISENVTNFLGYSTNDFYQFGIVKTVTLFPKIHNEIILNKIWPLMFEKFERHSIIGDVKDLHFSYNSYMTRKDGTQGLFLHQLTILNTDENNKPTIALKLVTDISFIKNDDTITFSISKKDKNDIYHPIFTQNYFVENEKELLTSRELEVLNLVSKGKSSTEIAELLFISENTVYNHRKNMLKKMDVKNTGELLTKAIANHLI